MFGSSMCIIALPCPSRNDPPLGKPIGWQAKARAPHATDHAPSCASKTGGSTHPGPCGPRQQPRMGTSQSMRLRMCRSLGGHTRCSC
eukprot:12543757-Alexandrium_andersonii.AAC.1